MHYLPRDHHHPPEPEGPGTFDSRGAALARDFHERAFTIGIGGPVGSGKTALLLALCRLLRDDYNLAVVTNVLPYIISLSALIIMMKSAGVSPGKYQFNVAIALIAMLYSTYALYASGHSAVMGGMLVTAIAFIIWGFIAPRFAVQTQRTAAKLAAE